MGSMAIIIVQLILCNRPTASGKITLFETIMKNTLSKTFMTSSNKFKIETLVYKMIDF